MATARQWRDSVNKARDRFESAALDYPETQLCFRISNEDSNLGHSLLSSLGLQEPWESESTTPQTDVTRRMAIGLVGPEVINLVRSDSPGEYTHRH